MTGMVNMSIAICCYTFISCFQSRQPNVINNAPELIRCDEGPAVVYRIGHVVISGHV